MALQDVVTTFDVSIVVTRRAPKGPPVIIREDVMLFTPDESAAWALMDRLRQAAGGVIVRTSAKRAR